MAFFAVKRYVVMNKIDPLKMFRILTWKLSEIFLNPYRTAFAIQYLTVSLSSHLKENQIKRLLVLCCFAIDKVDYG